MRDERAIEADMRDEEAIVMHLEKIKHIIENKVHIPRKEHPNEKFNPNEFAYYEKLYREIERWIAKFRYVDENIQRQMLSPEERERMRSKG